MIDYADGEGPSASEVEFVAGPRSGEREPRRDFPATIDAPGGTYRRSLACADDGAIRYIWAAIASGRTREAEQAQASATVVVAAYEAYFRGDLAAMLARRLSSPMRHPGVRITESAPPSSRAG